MAKRTSDRSVSKMGLYLVVMMLQVIPLAALATNVTAPPYSAVGDGKTDDTAAFQSALAAISAAGGGILFVPQGKYVISSTLVIPTGTTIEGSGEGATTLESQVLGNPLLSIQSNFAKVKNMTINWDGTATPTAGTEGIYSAYSGSTGTLQAENFEFSHLDVIGFYDNIYINGSSDGIVTDIYSTNAQHDGIVGLYAQGYWTSLVIVANQGDGIYLGVSTAGSGGVAPFMSGIQTYGNGGWGIHTVDNIFLGGLPSYLNNDSQGELLIDGSQSADSGHVANADIQYAGQNPFSSTSGYSNVSTAPGVDVTANAGPVRFTDVSMFQNNGDGLLINTSSVQVSNVRILGSGYGGTGYCVLSTGSQNEFTNVLCNSPSEISGNATIVRGNHFTASSNTLPTLLIPSGSNMIVSDNVIYNGGTAAALSVSAGVTVANASNMVIGSFSNAGTASGYYTTMFH